MKTRHPSRCVRTVRRTTTGRMSRHIGTAGKTTDDENLKLFTDMYLMVDAQKVYSIVGKGLYPSAFPEYSAKIGNKPFERVEL